MCVLSDADFKRAVGVQRDIFNIMLEAIKKNIRDFGPSAKIEPSCPAVDDSDVLA